MTAPTQADPREGEAVPVLGVLDVYDPAAWAEFTVPGLPVPYTRAMRGHRSPQAERYRGYRALVGWHAKEAGVQCVESGPMKLLVNAYIPDRMKRRWDVDNVVKGISDALNGIAWRDDKQVVVVYGRVEESDEPFVFVRVLRADDSWLYGKEG